MAVSLLEEGNHLKSWHRDVSHAGQEYVRPGGIRSILSRNVLHMLSHTASPRSEQSGMRDYLSMITANFQLVLARAVEIDNLNPGDNCS